MNNERLYQMPFSSVYPLYIQKVEKKGRNKDELNTVVCWLTGYIEQDVQAQIEKEVSLRTFFSEAPRINPNADKIKGVICGVRVEEITDPLMQKIRWLDKLVDELAKGKTLSKVLRD